MEILDHKNIIHLYETYETADSLFIVMEYVPGVNLDEHLKQSNGHLSEDEARHVFRQLVSAVDYCHRHWVVHRDIKVCVITLLLLLLGYIAARAYLHVKGEIKSMFTNDTCMH